MQTLPPEEDRPGVPAPPPLLVAVPLALLLALDLAWPTTLRMGIWRFVVGGVLVILGVAWVAMGARTQTRAGTEFLPDRPSTRIVTHGVYGATRNPMYLGFVLAGIGVAVLADSWWGLLGAVAGALLLDRLVIVREERYLERKFGEEYLAYKRRVRRWL